MMRKFILLLLFILWATPVLAAQPLLQEGKKTVYQRAVSHPSAVLYEDAEATREMGNPRTFTSFYIYDRKGDMVQVGVSTTGPEGWIKADQLTDWPQAITMVFTPRAGRDPVLFFKDHQSLEELCTSDGIGEKVEAYLAMFNGSANAAENSPVLASEPGEGEGAVAEDHFYLLPVTNMDEQFAEGGTKLLEVACIDPGTGEIPGQTGEDTDQEEQNDEMQMGIVFVVDTTISMRPYIEQTKEIIRQVFDELQDSPARDNVKFAVVAFRSDVKKSPKTQYNTKIISGFKSVSQRSELEALLNDLQESTASTHAFDEDSLAGVQAAIEGVDDEGSGGLSWDGIDSRAMLLVTDAGPLGAGDPSSATGMSPEAMADLLRRNNIFLTAVHVKAPGKAAQADHAYAEKSYKELSLYANGRSSYIALPAPDPKTGAENFHKIGTAIADKYRQVAELSTQGKTVQKPQEIDLPSGASPEDQARHTAEAIGYAMQLQFAGNRQGTSAPQVVRAWVADADLSELEKNPDADPVPAIEPAVLLTKSQLSQLRKQVQTIIDTAQEAFLQGKENFNFYEQLISAAAAMSRDPDAFSRDPNANLVENGVLLEALDGLPYKSQILRMKAEDWANMSTGAQQEFIRRLRGLVRNYEKYDRDNQLWEGFGSPDPNEWVYRVPLKMLP